MRKRIIAVFICICFLAVAASESFAGDDLRYIGCGIVAKAFMNELSKKFTSDTGVNMSIKGGGATTGIRDVASGSSVLGGTCRYALDVPEEKGVKLHHVAWDALAVIVNKDNPVDSITLEQLKDIIEGRITDWAQLGGPAGQPVAFYAREGKISGVGLMARVTIFNDPDKEFKADKIFDSTGPMEKAIEKDKWAIGLTGISSARKRDVKILKLNGIDISKGNIASGKYLLYRPLYLVTKENADPQAMKFVEFAKSNTGQRLISEQGTVNLKEGAMLWRLYRKQIKQ